MERQGMQTKLRGYRSKHKRYRNNQWMRVNIVLWVMIAVVTLFVVTIVLPGILVKRIAEPTAGQSTVSNPADPKGLVLSENKEAVGVMKQEIMIPVYLSKLDRVESIALEEYVRGVLAAEMPAEFELEALKAQALAARTYIYRRMIEKDTSNVPVEGALVTDTTAHQAFLTEESLAQKWTGEDYTKYMVKMTQAIEETRNLILTYQGKPINATFFSMSNGYTENAEEIWPSASPYLKSVPSPWDLQVPGYKETVTLSYKDVIDKLDVASISIAANNSKAAAKTGIQVIERTNGGRIKKISIGGTIFTGTEVREKLGLRSTSFEWKWNGTGKKAQLEVTTYGYGHGVGMSQWGANELAKKGKTAEEIVRYYYKGISISEASK
jgi:stage II sporulation protein D